PTPARLRAVRVAVHPVCDGGHTPDLCVRASVGRTRCARTTAPEGGRIMATLLELVSAPGLSTLDVVVSSGDPIVQNVGFAELDLDLPMDAGELLLGPGLTEPDQVERLLDKADGTPLAGLLLRPPLVEDPRVVAAAARRGTPLVRVPPAVSWTHVMEPAQSVLELDAALGTRRTEGTGRDDLVTIADSIAKSMDAPVTIEDP